MQELLDEAPSGDPLRHPDLVALVADLRRAFPDSPAAALEQQALDLITHVAPEQLAAVIAQYRVVLADPERLAQARDLERRFAALAELAPDDPEVELVETLLLASVTPAQGDRAAGGRPASAGHRRPLGLARPAGPR